MGGGKFLDVARPLGADGNTDGRGVAIADLNGDGKLDIIMSNNNGPPTIYLNRLRKTGHWTRLTLMGTSSNRDAVGARVRLTATIGGRSRTMTRQVEAGSGYASQSPGSVHFGLADATKIDSVEIQWPGGGEQRFEGAEVAALLDRSVWLKEGSGFANSWAAARERRAAKESER